MAFKVQFLNCYNWVIDEVITDEFYLPEIQRSLPKKIGDEIALGILWFRDGKHKGTYWHRKDSK